ncbi:MAG: hypothetical protein ABSD70_06910 [Terracidiphilus sp.]|jgi:hypothetical protein
MSFAIFVLQLTQGDVLQPTQDYSDGSILTVVLVTLVAVTAMIMCGLWYGRPKRQRSRHR